MYCIYYFISSIFIKCSFVFHHEISTNENIDLENLKNIFYDLFDENKLDEQEEQNRIIMEKVKEEYPFRIFNFNDKLYHKIYMCQSSENINFDENEAYELISFGLPRIETELNISRSILISFLKTDLYEQVYWLYLKKLHRLMGILGYTFYTEKLQKIINNDDYDAMFKFICETVPNIMIQLEHEMKKNSILSVLNSKISEILHFKSSLDDFLEICVSKFNIKVFEDNSRLLFEATDEKSDYQKKNIKLDVCDIHHIVILDIFPTKIVYFFNPTNSNQKLLFSFIENLSLFILDLNSSLFIEYNLKGKLNDQYISLLNDFITTSIIKKQIILKIKYNHKFYFDENIIKSDLNTVTEFGIYFSRYILRVSFQRIEGFKNMFGSRSKEFLNFKNIYNLLNLNNNKDSICVQEAKFYNKNFINETLNRKNIILELEKNSENRQKKDIMIFEFQKGPIKLEESELTEIFTFCKQVLIVGGFCDIFISFPDKPMFVVIFNEFYYFRIAENSESLSFPDDLQSYNHIYDEKIMQDIVIETNKELNCIIGDFLKVARSKENSGDFNTEIILIKDKNIINIINAECIFIKLPKCRLKISFFDCIFQSSVNLKKMNLFDKKNTRNKLFFDNCIFYSDYILHFNSSWCGFYQCTILSCFVFEEHVNGSIFYLNDCSGSFRFFGIYINITPNILFIPELIFNFLDNIFTMTNYALNGIFRYENTFFKFRIEHCAIDVIFILHETALNIFNSRGSFCLYFTKIDGIHGRIYIEEKGVFSVFISPTRCAFKFEFLIFEKNPAEFLKKYAKKIYSIKDCSYISDDESLITIPNLKN